MAIPSRLEPRNQHRGGLIHTAPITKLTIIIDAPTVHLSLRCQRTGVHVSRFDIHDVIRPEDWKDQPDPLFYITARYRRSIEMMVRTAPEQYFWMHRVWKSRPKHERLRRDFPESLRRKLLDLPWMDEAEVERIEAQSMRDIEELDRLGGNRLE